MHVNYIEWRIHPFRANRWLEAWAPAIERAAAFGARECYLTRNIDDPLHFRQVSVWEHTADFDRYWASDEIGSLREAALTYYNKPVLWVWHSLNLEAGAAAAVEATAEVAD